MLLTELLNTALKGVIANPKRSLLSALGIIIGIASVITILSLGAGIKKETLHNLNANQNGKQTININYLPNDTTGDQTGFNEADLILIKQSSPNCTKAKFNYDSTDLRLPVTINELEQPLQIKLAGRTTNRKLNYGHNLNITNYQAHKNSALISKSLAKKTFKHPANAIGLTLVIGINTYTIIGVTEKSSFDLIIPKSTFIQNQRSNEGNQVTLTFKHGSNVNREAKQIAKQLQKTGSHHLDGTYIYTDLGDLLKGISKVINGLTNFITAVAAISLFIAGIGVMNMMYISVAERTQEIGIRMSLGASQKNIMTQFLFEALFLTGFGGIIGFLIGIGIAKAISNFLPFTAVVTVESLFLSIGISTLVGLIFGILPAKTAAHQNLINILR